MGNRLISIMGLADTFGQKQIPREATAATEFTTSQTSNFYRHSSSKIASEKSELTNFTALKAKLLLTAIAPSKKQTCFSLSLVFAFKLGTSFLHMCVLSHGSLPESRIAENFFFLLIFHSIMYNRSLKLGLQTVELLNEGLKNQHGFLADWGAKEEVFGFTVVIHAQKYTTSSSFTKGQLISKCPFGVFKSSKKPSKFFPGFLPQPLKRGQIKKVE